MCKLVRFDSTLLGIYDFPNVDKILDIKKVYDLVNISGLLKESLKGPCFSVSRVTTNSVHFIDIDK